MSIDVDFKFPDWAAKLRRHEARLRLFQAALIQTNRGMMFDAEGAHNNHEKWAKLKFRNGQILSRRGNLRKSIAPYNPRGVPGPDGIVRFAGDMIVVGTKMLYARMMNDGTAGMPGGVLRPKRAKALKIPLPSGVSASNEARQARSAPDREAVADMEASLVKARERASKARVRFQDSGNHDHLRAAVNAEYRVARLTERIGAKRVKVARALGKGKGGRGFLFVNSVKIPARPFDEWNVSDQQEMDAAVANKIAEILNA